MKTIKIKDDVYFCECGQPLSVKPVDYMTNEIWVCPKCDKQIYVERCSIDFVKAICFGGKNNGSKS